MMAGKRGNKLWGRGMGATIGETFPPSFIFTSALAFFDFLTQSLPPYKVSNHNGRLLGVNTEHPIDQEQG